eukprot:9234310-Alexandrium_andersonii.AAC.1
MRLGLWGRAAHERGELCRAVWRAPEAPQVESAPWAASVTAPPRSLTPCSSCGPRIVWPPTAGHSPPS